MSVEVHVLASGSDGNCYYIGSADKGILIDCGRTAKQITEALHSMQDSTLEVKNASAEMEEGNKMILKEVQALQDASMNMTQSMEEMSIGAKNINETGAALSEVSDQINHSIDKIGVQVDQFKV